jgi:K+-transporting ATPase KdpF subunit
MNGIYWVGLAVGIVLFFYLMVALVRPEKF